MHEVQTFLRQAWAEAESARIAKERADQEDKVKARQKRKNALSMRYAQEYGANGVFLGVPVMGFAGCVSCLDNYSPGGGFDFLFGFNIITGVLIGAIGGALIGAIIGALKGQNEI